MTIQFEYLSNKIKLFAFRLIFLLFILFIILMYHHAFPCQLCFNTIIEEPFKQIIPWIGKHIFQFSYEINVFPNSRVDTPYDYIKLLIIIFIAIIGSTIWIIYYPEQANNAKLNYWLFTTIRYYVALMMIHYGLLKVFELQFPYPDLITLSETYGESSPIQLTWAFLGYSKGYNCFIGFCELASFLLFFRQTMTIGAIITLITLLNVLAVNYFYDVSVKILSSTLFIMTLFLIIKDSKQLWLFFFINKSAKLSMQKAIEVKSKLDQCIKIIIKCLIVSLSLLYSLYYNWKLREQLNERALIYKQIEGIYKVDKFIFEGDTLLPNISNLNRWNKFIIVKEGVAKVTYMNDSAAYFRINLNLINKSIEFEKNSINLKFILNYNLINTKLHLYGDISEKSYSILLTQTPLNNKLKPMRFHWVNPTSYFPK